MTTTGDIRPGTNRPGGHAEQEFRQLRKDYRRRIRRITVPVFVAFLALALWGASRTDWLTAMICLLAGGLMTIYIVLRDEPPQAIQNWADGAAGERRTAKCLQELPSAEWHLWHDLNGAYGNIDHLVVGPAGVFVMDTKVWAGQSLTFEGSAPVLTRLHAPVKRNRYDKVPRTARVTAARQAEALKKRAGLSVWVTPVIVAWSETERPATQVDGVTYVRGDEIANWLLALPQRLSHEKVTAIAAAVGQ